MEFGPVAQAMLVSMLFRNVHAACSVAHKMSILIKEKVALAHCVGKTRRTYSKAMEIMHYVQPRQKHSYTQSEYIILYCWMDE